MAPKPKTKTETPAESNTNPNTRESQVKLIPSTPERKMGKGEKTLNKSKMPRAKHKARERGKKEKMARIAGANYTDEASLKHTCTLITVDRDAIGGGSV